MSMMSECLQGNIKMRNSRVLAFDFYFRNAVYVVISSIISFSFDIPYFSAFLNTHLVYVKVNS